MLRPVGRICGRADQIAARNRGDEAGRQRAQDAGDFGVLLQLRVDAGALGRVHRRQQVQIVGAGGGAHRAAHDVQAIGDQRGLGLEQFQPQGGGGMACHIDDGGLFGDQRFQISAFGGDRRAELRQRVRLSFRSTRPL